MRAIATAAILVLACLGGTGPSLGQAGAAPPSPAAPLAGAQAPGRGPARLAPPPPAEGSAAAARAAPERRRCREQARGLRLYGLGRHKFLQRCRRSIRRGAQQPRS